MGFQDSISSFGKAVSQRFTGASGSKDTLTERYNSEFSDANIWSINGENWYQVYGYQFKITDSEQSDGYYYTLPIPPQSLQINPTIPAKATATMGGVTEEHSPIVFWQINMSGTTGTAVGRRQGDEETRKFVAGKFRDVLSTTGLLAGKFAQINQAVNKIGGLIDGAINTFQNVTNAKNPLDAITSATGGVVGSVNNALLPPLPYSSSAVDANSNGFKEAKELEKFFYMYQSLKSANPRRYNLYFISYKTNQQWRVIVKNFGLQQSANEPMLLRYQISLQGWDCQKANGDPELAKAFDRYSNGDLKTVNTMAFGSDSVKNSLKNIKNRFKIKT